MRRWLATSLTATALLVACDGTDSPTSPRTDRSPATSGTPAPESGGIFVDERPTEPCALEARVRDFKAEHPDFEGIVNTSVITELVEPTLGPDGKPRIVASRALLAGIQAFDDWYNDRPGVNQEIPVALTLEERTDGVFLFDSKAFFPVDGRGFGDEGRRHNYHFTTEIHTRFTYRGGERFTFAGDDDVWVFINGKRAIDLGGVRAREMATVDLDAQRDLLGITPGQQYTMDIFHAERHTVESNFRIETTIDCFQRVP